MVSSKVDYGVRLLRQLMNLNQGKPVPLGALAQQLNLPYHYLARIAHQLTQAGILESFEGSKGGYRLARRPAQVTFADILVALQPRRRPVGCLRADRCCRHHGSCDLQQWWREFDNRLMRQLHSITLGFGNK